MFQFFTNLPPPLLGSLDCLMLCFPVWYVKAQFILIALPFLILSVLDTNTSPSLLEVGDLYCVQAATLPPTARLGPSEPPSKK